MSAIDLTVLESDFDASQGTVSHRFLSDWSPQPMTSTIDADVEEASMWKGVPIVVSSVNLRGILAIDGVDTVQATIRDCLSPVGSPVKLAGLCLQVGDDTKGTSPVGSPTSVVGLRLTDALMNDDSKFTSTQPKREFQEWTPSTPSSRPCFTLPASLIGAS
uniref:Uncharacterized protein n=1 Tax=Prymnesium polylepis TaxID=72548 RepID=A0A6V4WTB7_9EUKA|mmetsp:Transcript_12946/g.33939  ORF Transcript_12946/g.33939 Transcript_12946/m.33939 type:complete len:161 (+) Transcript_12946:68-550(+)